MNAAQYAFVIVSLVVFALMCISFIQMVANAERPDQRGGGILGLVFCVLMIFGGLFALFS
jgi:hypothetical protein